MAVGTFANFTIYDEQVHTGFIETAAQNRDLFNSASRGAIRLDTDLAMGHFDQESFFKDMGDLEYRDITATPTDAGTVEEMTTDEIISVKLNRYKIISQTLDAFKKRNPSDDDGATMSLVLGRQLGVKTTLAQLNDILTSGVAAASGETTGGPSGSGLFLDKTSTDTSGFYVMGLTEAGLSVMQSEVPTLATERKTGGTQLYDQMQMEIAYNAGVKGFKWDTANGGVNPDAAALALATNWDLAASDLKNCHGILGKFGDTTAEEVVTTALLIDMLELMGDAENRIVAWVSHSGAWFQLLRDQLTNAAYTVQNIVGTVVNEAQPVTLNRPWLVTDSASLKFAP